MAGIGARLFGWPLFWIAAVLAELGAGGVLVWAFGRHGPAVLAVAANLAVCARFAVTLRHGSVPLITRYARHDRAGLPPGAEAYTRRLTAVWVWFLLAAAFVHAGAIIDIWTTAVVGTAQGVLMVALFLGEHPLRGRLFPELAPATPWRTFGAMRRAHEARHAG